ncbi:MAG TPA: hypothetical protein VD931_22725 [Baekduia sp.]|nr:hypothetical protein [Baekduia sp.]
MALRLSAALRNALLETGSLKHMMSNCVLKVYTGSQPATAETAPSGTLLVTYSNASGAITREVLSVGSVDLTGGSSGSVDAITVNSIAILPSAVTYTTSLANTASLVATAINNNPKNLLFTADVSDTDKINIRAKPGLGSLPNGWVVASTVTTLTKTDSNMAGGVTAVNALTWGDSAAGVLVKHPSETWSGVAAATGTAGWFRIEAAVSDAGGTDSSEAILRIDGAIATSGAELNMASTSITASAVQTISSFSITIPTA